MYRSFLNRLLGHRLKQSRDRDCRRNLLGGVERFEARCVLDASPWCNVPLPADVNNDGVVTELDVQAVQTTIANGSGSGSGSGQVQVVQGTSPSNGGFPDATNDWWVNQADVDFVNSAISSGSGSGSGSSSNTGYGGFTIGPAESFEGETVMFPVTFTGNSPGGADVTLDASSGTATAGYDFGAGSGSSSGSGSSVVTLHFSGNNGEVQYFSVPTIEDDYVEDDETFTGTITGASAPAGWSLTGAGQAAEGKIKDDGDTAEVSWSILPGTGPSGTLLEGSAVAPGTVTIKGTLSKPNYVAGLSIPYTFIDGSATAATDYVGTAVPVAVPVSVVGAAPTLTFTVTLSFKGDNILEFINESYQVKFGGIGPKLIVDQNPVMITIRDDDTAVVQMLPVAAVNENAGTVKVDMQFLGTSEGGFSVDVSTSGVTAHAPEDYVADAEVAHFSGALNQVVSVNFAINDDLIDEAATETFTVAMANIVTAIGYEGRITISPTAPSRTVTINDNDISNVTISNAWCYEELTSDAITRNTLTFHVSLSKQVDVATTLTYTLGGGSAGFVFPGTGVPGADITAAAGAYTVVIPAYSDGVDIQVFTAPDGTDEDHDTFTVTLNSLVPPAGQTRSIVITTATGTGTIYDYGVGEGWLIP